MVVSFTIVTKTSSSSSGTNDGPWVQRPDAIAIAAAARSGPTASSNVPAADATGSGATAWPGTAGATGAAGSRAATRSRAITAVAAAAARPGVAVAAAARPGAVTAVVGVVHIISPATEI